MMFGILKSIIWIAGALVVAYFVMGYFGYQISMDYFKESKATCQQRIKECSESLIREGINNAQCDLLCIDRNLVIKRK